MEQDFIKELAYVGFATRLKRISDNMIQEGRKLYKELELDIEPNWFVVFKLIQANGSTTVTEIAKHIGFAHPSVIAIVNKMTRAGYISSTKSDGDSRVKILELTSYAEEKLPEFERIWKAGSSGMASALDDLNALDFLTELEERFKEKGFKARTLEQLDAQRKVKQSVQIVPYEPHYREAFEKLNNEWLEKHFYIEDYDREVLQNPDKYILEPGGQILYAKLNNNIVGVVALIVRGEDTFELSKMGVTESAQGKGIGKLLMEAAISYSKKRGMKTVMLDSNRKLAPAINLYIKMGFKEIPVPSNTPYERCNIRMELHLS